MRKKTCTTKKNILTQSLIFTTCSHVFILLGIIAPWQSYNLALHQFYWIKYFKEFYLLCYLGYIFFSKKKIFFNIMLFFLFLYPVTLILNPSWFYFIENESNIVNFLKRLLGFSIFESNFKQIKIVNTYSFVAYGYFLTLVGTIMILKKRKFNLLLFIKLSFLTVFFLCFINIFIHLSSSYLERNNLLGKKIFYLLNKINKKIDIISNDFNLYLEVGEFDAFNGFRTSYASLFLIYTKSQNNYLSEAIYELSKLKLKKNKSMFNYISFILAKDISQSSFSINQKINLLERIYHLNPTIEIKLILGTYYYKNFDFQNSIIILTNTINQLRNRYLLSDIFNVLGDIYSYSSVEIAREYYQRSLKAYDRVKGGNFHAFKGLAGW